MRQVSGAVVVSDIRARGDAALRNDDSVDATGLLPGHLPSEILTFLFRAFSEFRSNVHIHLFSTETEERKEPVT